MSPCIELMEENQQKPQKVIVFDVHRQHLCVYNVLDTRKSHSLRHLANITRGLGLFQVFAQGGGGGGGGGQMSSAKILGGGHVYIYYKEEQASQFSRGQKLPPYPP